MTQSQYCLCYYDVSRSVKMSQNVNYLRINTVQPETKQPQASNLNGTKIRLVTSRLRFAKPSRYSLNLRCRLIKKKVTCVSTLCVGYVSVHHDFHFPQRFCFFFLTLSYSCTFFLPTWRCLQETKLNVN